jgi:ribonuclease HII
LLRNVNLEFNPISQLPYYRYHVIFRLPQIRTLDSREIAPQERTKAASIIKKEQTTLELMFNNECLIAKLSRGIEAVQTEEDLRARVIKRLRLAGSKLKKRTMFDLWEMQEFFTGKYYHSLS